MREEVRNAGFKLVAEADFLRNPADARDWNADSTVNRTHTQDRLELRFAKPLRRQPDFPARRNRRCSAPALAVVIASCTRWQACASFVIGRCQLPTA